MRVKPQSGLRLGQERDILQYVIKRIVRNGENGIMWCYALKLDDLDCTDDITSISSTKQQIQQQ